MLYLNVYANLQFKGSALQIVAIQGAPPPETISYLAWTAFSGWPWCTFTFPDKINRCHSICPIVIFLASRYSNTCALCVLIYSENVHIQHCIFWKKVHQKDTHRSPLTFRQLPEISTMGCDSKFVGVSVQIHEPRREIAHHDWGKMHQPNYAWISGWKVHR